jgi:hypothetical protein
MEYVSTLERVLPCLFIPILSSCIMMSSAPIAPKVVLGLVLLGLAVVFSLHPVFTKEAAVGSVLLGILIFAVHQDPVLTFWIVGFLGICALLRTLFHYIDAPTLLMVLVCTITILYGTFFAMAMIAHLDALGMALFSIQAFLVWNSFLALRPALPRNRIHNE